MDRYYDDGFSGFKRQKPAEQSAMGSFMNDSALASAWYPKEKARNSKFVKRWKTTPSFVLFNPEQTADPQHGQKWRKP